MPVPVFDAKTRSFGICRRKGAQAGLPLLVFGALCGCMTLGDDVPPPTMASLSPAEIRPAIAVEPVPMAPPAVPPAAVVTRAPTPTSRPARAPRATQTQRPARERAIDPEHLIGLDPAAVHRLLGAPARVQDDKLSREWVYAAPGCNFRIFFYPNLNAASFRVLKYGGNDENGERLAASNACVRRILTARNNAAD
jgi:hypothetical protein